MKVETLRFKAPTGWTPSTFPPLDSARTLVMVFGAPGFRDHPQPIRDLLACYPTSQIMGCSSAGEIYDSGVDDESLSVAVIQFEKTALRSAVRPLQDLANSRRVGQELAERLQASDLRAVFVLSEGVNVNGSELIAGFNDRLTDNVLVTGGLAGDGSRFQSTWVLDRAELKTGSVAAIGFYGDHIRVGHGCRGGWDVFGPERRVTRSAGNILFELDHKPALALYKDYLGDRARDLPSSGLLFPLSVRLSDHDDRTLVRTILGVDETAQSLTFAGDVPQGCLAQLMKANFDRLIDAAGEAGQCARRTLGGTSEAVLAIAISCVGRRLILGQRTEEETEASMEALPKGCRQIGFYSYGELSPFSTGRCDLHNQTMTQTTFQED